MNTGHDGSLTSIHANSPRDALSRIETLSLMGSGDIPILALRKQIVSAIDKEKEKVKEVLGDLVREGMVGKEKGKYGVK
jgi:Flp pilus assembly CpaF family ATPase